MTIIQTMATYLSAFCVLFSVLYIKVSCHIGQPCNLLGLCMPISSHIYCDNDKICRCRKEYPIEVGPHSCLTPKRVADRCSHPEECTYYDSNSFCNQSPYSSRCECNQGFILDKNLRKCVIETKTPRKGSSPALMIPTAAGLLMACFSVLCCCALIWHNLCRKHTAGHNASSSGTRTGRRHQTSDSRRAATGLNNRRNQPTDGQLAAHLPPYESILIDSMNNDPPPSYEDVIKDTHLAAQHTTTTAHNDTVDDSHTTETKIT